MNLKLEKQSIGENVRGYRKKRGLEQKEVAMLTGLSCPTISNIELNKKVPSIKTLIKVSHALKCKVTDLMQY